MSALNHMVGGSHYKQKMQVIQVTYLLGASPCWKMVAKYITRKKDNPKQDLEKAIHCIQLEDELLELRCSKYITEMQEYEHPTIKEFAEQFEDVEFVQYVLQDMYFGFLDRAMKRIEARLNDTN